MEEPLVLMNLFFSFVSFLEDALALSRWRIIPFPFIDIMFHFSDQTTGNRHLYGWSIQVPNARNRCLHSESSRHKKQWPLLIEPGFHASTSFSFCDNHCSFFSHFSVGMQNRFFFSYNNVMQKWNVCIPVEKIAPDGRTLFISSKSSLGIHIISLKFSQSNTELYYKRHSVEKKRLIITDVVSFHLTLVLFKLVDS